MRRAHGFPDRRRRHARIEADRLYAQQGKDDHCLLFGQGFTYRLALGERHFARHLVDYDPCVNNGNWQWAASTGCDAQPYFRIFNPWRQQQKFDPQCRYIYRWLPELEKIPVEIIQRWDKKHGDGAYPKPIIDHKIASAYSKELFKNC
nr:FAD-binding domain-containing protein [Methylomarinum sp. Ch1-1]MDP4522535.1 FAD-binding domain-containing protein [Methylomarinum sp. Ch1-1]